VLELPHQDPIERRVIVELELNVLIIRTVDLLFLMRHMESAVHRREDFMRLMSSGGGWLKADPEGYRIV
jgi:hypothetical protein